MMGETIFLTEDLTMRFGGHTAVNRVSLEIAAGRFTSIIGPNGAGKTTFFNLLSGQLLPVAGKVLYKGTDITGLPPHYRARLGIGRSFQITNVFPNLTALENVRLAVQAQEKLGYRFWRSYKRFSHLEVRAWELLEKVFLTRRGRTAAKNLSHGDKRKLELAIILALEPEVLLLDEPTAGMSLEEVPAILKILKQLKEEGEKTILLVEHKIDMVMLLSDRIAVLNNGELLVVGTPPEIAQNEQVQAAYLGGI
jgi:branched-chain amino acid transport system ATP-binding protein